MAKLNTLREFIETQLKQRDMSARQFSELVGVNHNAGTACAAASVICAVGNCVKTVAGVSAREFINTRV